MRYFIILLAFVLSGCYVNKNYDTYYYDEIYYPLRGNHPELVIPSGNIFTGWQSNQTYNNQNTMRWCYQCNVHYYGFYHIHNNCCVQNNNNPVIINPNTTNVPRPSIYNQNNIPQMGGNRPSINQTPPTNNSNSPTKPKIPTTPRSPR